MAQAPDCSTVDNIQIQFEQPHIPSRIIYWSFNQQAYLATDISSFQPISLTVLEGIAFPFLFGFSPDGERLGYYEITPTIGFLPSEGQLLTHSLNYTELLSLAPKDVLLSGWGRPKWINNDIVQITVSYRESIGANQKDQFLVFANITQGLWMPEIVAQLPNHQPLGVLTVSPDLTRALYPEENDRQMVLWDRETLTALWSSSTPPDGRLARVSVYDFSPVAWSPDSEWVAYVGPEHPQSGHNGRGVYLLSRDGRINRLITNFALRYEEFGSDGLNWSPNSRFLSFSGSSFDGHKLYIYDFVAGKYVLQCPLENDEYYARVYWSPNSQYIAYDFGVASPLVVLDVESGNKAKLTDRVSIVGWIPNVFTFAQKP